MHKVVQTSEVAEAQAKMEEILAKNKKPERFKITPQMRREAAIKALQDGDLDK